MKIKKILLGSIVAGTMLAGLVGCGSGEEFPADGTKLTLWVSETEGVVDLTKQQIKDFNASNNAGIKINPTIEAVSEANAATQMLTDVSAGADIYCFAQDQFARLVQGGALSEVASSVAESIKKDNAQATVQAVTSGSKIYAYPMTADNGYFLYYDTRVLTADDVKDMDTLLTKLEAAGKNISFEMQSSAWYNASYFFGAGCVSEWKTDDTGKFVEVNDTFDSDKGLIAIKGMQRLVKSKSHVSSSDAADLKAATPSAALVSGTWSYNTVKDTLGENMGVAELPSYKVDGKSYHLGSFSGYKLMGVKPQTSSEKIKAAQLLAEYLTSEKCQLERFNKVAWGPSNLNAQKDPAVVANPALAALNKQNQYAKPQGQIHGGWWDVAKVISTAAKDADTGDETALKAALKDYSDALQKMLKMSPEELKAWTVIGGIAALEAEDGKWTVDYKMVEEPANTWTSEQAFELAAGDEFKVRQGKSWDKSFGKDGGNFVVDTAGTYKIKFVYDEANDTGTVSLVAAN